MASLMTLEVLTPDQYLMKRKDIAYVLLNTVTGGIGILANHGPLIAVLGEGTLKLQDGNNHVILLYVEGGFAEVKDNKVIILTPKAELAEHIDVKKDTPINKEEMIAQVATTPKETDKDTPQQKTPSNKRIYTQQMYNDYQYEYHHSKRHNSELRISTYYSGIMSSYNNSQQGIMLADACFYGESSEKLVNDKKYYDVYPTEELITETKHHQPIKLGISLNYKIDDSWSLQTGFTYSYLSSDFNINSHGEKNIKEQKLHYIGLPVSVSYSIWHNDAVNIYATTGGEVEKLVNGNAKTTHDINGAETYSTTENIKSNKLLFSTNAAAGIEYKAGKSFNLYAEPGVSYHFKNGSDIKNIYTKNPLNFNLNLGIRININK
mgnify:CR=1 FL=1